MKDEKIRYELFYNEGIKKIKQNILLNLAHCYKTIFNNTWKEDWTQKSALVEIKKALTATQERKPILSLMFADEKVVGFAWNIFSAIEGLTVDDMPYDISKKEKEKGLRKVRQYLKSVSQQKVLIYRDLGIYPKYQNWGREHIPSKMTVPMTDIALRNEYKILFIWTSLTNPIFQHGMRFGWKLVCYYKKNDLIIMSGKVKKFQEYLLGILDKNKKLMNEMFDNRNKFLAKHSMLKERMIQLNKEMLKNKKKFM
ncbi:hypothetical protein KAJ89_00665 [Candidatus Parcubacteria bacterium]|nr:hypothetical protein [Candidatus Parcubacteria bacterium]